LLLVHQDRNLEKVSKLQLAFVKSNVILIFFSINITITITITITLRLKKIKAVGKTIFSTPINTDPKYFVIIIIFTSVIDFFYF
jgi:hypothetical protein